MSRSALYTALAAALIITSAQCACADIYRFVDDSGVIHFSNIPEGDDTELLIPEKPEPVSYDEDVPELTPHSRLGRESMPYIPDAGEPLGEDVPYSEIINAKCARYGVEPQLVKAIIKAESNFNPNAVSSKGAVGLMQLMPATAAYLNVGNSYDPEQNIDGGVRYVRYLLDNFEGDVELTVAAYNCGEGRVYRNGNTVPNITETKNYVKKVMKLSSNPVTGVEFTRPIYRVELTDGSIMFTDSPIGTGDLSLVQ